MKLYVFSKTIIKNSFQKQEQNMHITFMGGGRSRKNDDNDQANNKVMYNGLSGIEKLHST